MGLGNAQFDFVANGEWNLPGLQIRCEHVFRIFKTFTVVSVHDGVNVQAAFRRRVHHFHPTPEGLVKHSTMTLLENQTILAVGVLGVCDDVGKQLIVEPGTYHHVILGPGFHLIHAPKMLGIVDVPMHGHDLKYLRRVTGREVVPALAQVVNPLVRGSLEVPALGMIGVHDARGHIHSGLDGMAGQMHVLHVACLAEGTHKDVAVIAVEQMFLEGGITEFVAVP